MNKTPVKKLAVYLVGISFLQMVFMQTVNAYGILFQDDSFATIESDNLVIDSNNSATTSNKKIQFGSNPIITNNGNIVWDALLMRFNVDQPVDVTGDLTTNNGLTVTGGNVDFSAAAHQRLRESPDPNTAACLAIGEVLINTTNKRIYTCTVPGTPGTWVSATPTTADFEGVYDSDAGKDLITTNGPFTVNTGTSDFIVDSNDWNVTAAGALDAATVTSVGLLTGLAGANVSGGTIDFNTNSNFDVNIAAGTSTGTVNVGGTGTQTINLGSGAGAKTVNLGSSGTTSTTNILAGSGGLYLNNSNGSSITNIGTGTTLGQVNIGGGSNCVNVDSYNWDISCAGNLSGLTGISSTGIINFSAAATFTLPQYAMDPMTCSPGEQYFNTVTATVRLCVTANTWSGSTPSGNQYVFAYDTTIQSVLVPGVFQDVTLSNNGQIDGWTHTPGTAEFISTVSGTFMSNSVARVAKSGGGNGIATFRAVVNGIEVHGSGATGAASNNMGDTISSNFIFVAFAGDTVKLQFTGDTTGTRIIASGYGDVKPSVQFNIWRMK